jgi:hypothetical protein
MEPITGNPELMLRFYQNALYLIGLVMSMAALGCGCVYALFVFTECLTGPHRRSKVVPRTAPVPVLAKLATAHGQAFQLRLAPHLPPGTSISAIPFLSARKAASPL